MDGPLQALGSTERLMVAPGAYGRRRLTGAPPPPPKKIGLSGELWLTAHPVPAGGGPVPSFDPDAELSFVPRSQLVTFVEQDEDMVLCGADAPCP